MISQSEPPATRPAAAYDYPLEALRGVAALLVALGHALSADPAPHTRLQPAGRWLYALPGHMAVLLFFLLSGYVIGLANPAPLATAAAHWHYLRKRLVRLYPLYVVALGITGLVAGAYHHPMSSKEWAGCLVFLQGFGVAMPAYNHSLWSLPYEIGYYLLFIVVSARGWPAGRVAVGGVVLGGLGTLLRVQPLALVALAYGAAFWFAGLALSRLPRRPGPPRYGAMLAWLLLLLAYQRLNPLYTILHRLGLDLDENVFFFFERPITFADLSHLLLGVPLLACFSNRTAPWLPWLERLAFAAPGLYLLVAGLAGRFAGPPALIFWLPVGSYVVAVAAYLLRRKWTATAARVVQGLQPLGSISYGVYIIHYPLLELLDELPVFNNSLATWVMRLVGYFAAVLAVSWLLERRLQPWLKRRLA
jgi:peptidoglycan/LPS O-acetylase OafA/YrhL